MRPSTSRSRHGTRLAGLAGVVFAVATVFHTLRSVPCAFAPLRAATLAGVLLTGTPSNLDVQDWAQFQSMDGSSVQLAEKSVILGGKANGGLDGTYEQKAGAKRKDFYDDEKALEQEEKFEQKFDQYIGVFAILFVGAFIAPMVTYFWYVRDSDPWQN